MTAGSVNRLANCYALAAARTIVQYQWQSLQRVTFAALKPKAISDHTARAWWLIANWCRLTER
jgi:hypothetical protein